MLPLKANQPRGSAQIVHKQIRGSGLLLSGNLISSLMNFATQVLIARSLTTTQFGAWAFALSVVQLLQGFSKLGLPDAMTRFVPHFQERQDFARLAGTVILAFMTILTLGILLAALFHFRPGDVAKLMHAGKLQYDLLLIMIFLVPVDSADGLLMGLFASFASPRAIFFRKHVLAPGLKLVVAITLILSHAGPTFLASGYLIASAVGVVFYCVILAHLLRSTGLLSRPELRRPRLPVRELFTYALPGVTSDLAILSMQTVAVLLLSRYHDLRTVALYRVVLPTAAMNTVVMLAFTLLYTPTAARLLARGDKQGINALYWQTAIWINLLSFPIFAATFCFARPVTELLFGTRYSSSASCLMLLSLGYYFNTATGFNGLTLKVLGKIRYIILINVFVAAAHVLISLLLIPRHGAIGAAYATAASMLLHNILKQLGLRLTSSIRVFDWHYVSLYLLVTAAVLGLTAVDRLTHPSIFMAGALVVCVSFSVFWLQQRHLNIADTFPEALRVPFVGRLLAWHNKPAAAMEVS
jgi:O-antigen/teichoic acid export membrane protein